MLRLTFGTQRYIKLFSLCSFCLLIIFSLGEAQSRQVTQYGYPPPDYVDTQPGRSPPPAPPVVVAPPPVIAPPVPPVPPPLGANFNLALGLPTGILGLLLWPLRIICAMIRALFNCFFAMQ